MEPVRTASILGLSVLGWVLLTHRGLAAAFGAFAETWGSYAIGTTPYGRWELEACAEGTLARRDAGGVGRCHSRAPLEVVSWSLWQLDHAIEALR